MIDYWPLLGIALVVLGFALRFNPLLVVAVAAIATGLLGGMPFMKVLAALVGSDEARREAQAVAPKTRAAIVLNAPIPSAPAG